MDKNIVKKGKGFLEEFKEFAVKGNVIDLAVGVIIGAAFGKIVSSLVSDIVMPLIGVVLGGFDFSNLKLVLKAATESNPAVTLNYGVFINNIIDFLIIAQKKTINSLSVYSSLIQ